MASAIRDDDWLSDGGSERSRSSSLPGGSASKKVIILFLDQIKREKGVW